MDQQILEDNKHDAKLAKEFGRSIDALQCRRKRLRKSAGLTKVRAYTVGEDLMIMAHELTNNELAKLFGRSDGKSITRRRRNLLKKQRRADEEKKTCQVG